MYGLILICVTYLSTKQLDKKRKDFTLNSIIIISMQEENVMYGIVLIQS